MLFAEVEWVQDFPATVNDDALVDALEHVCQETGIRGIEIPQPFRWSEDFGHFAEVCPILHFGLGIGEHAAGLHQPDYAFCDDTILTAVSGFYEMAKSVLSGYGSRGENTATGT